MSKTLNEGQILKYIGKDVENFEEDKPFAKFLGYDSNGWDDIWIEYKDQKYHVSSSDVEV